MESVFLMVGIANSGWAWGSGPENTLGQFGYI